MTDSAPAMLPRAVDSTFSLAPTEGQELAVLYPAQYHSLAERLAASIERRGGPRPELVLDTDLMPTRSDPLLAEYRRRPLIVLGSLNTNRAVMTLYANFHCTTDATFPGGDGYDLRTIVNPYGTGSKVLLVGGSTAHGVERAVERLEHHLDGAIDLTLPFILDVELGRELAQRLAEWPETPLGVELPSLAQGMKIAWGFYVVLMRAIGAYGIMYVWTGDRRYGDYARDCLRLLNDTMDDSYGDWHYRAERVLRVLPWLVAGGFLDEADLQRTDELLLNTALGTQDMWWRMSTAEPPFGHRHHGRGTFEFLLIARYLLQHGRPNDAAQALCKRWVHECQTYLDALAVARIEDQDDETSLNNMSMLYWYALGEERYAFFESGNARLVAERGVALHDSMGAGAGWGGYGESHSGVMYLQMEATTGLAASTFYYQDGRYKWILESMPNLADPIRFGFLDFAPPFTHKFDTGPELPPVQPDTLAGVQILKATPHQLAINNAPPEHIEYQGHMVNAPETWLLGEGVGKNTLDGDRALDKIVMRSSFDPHAAYLLLQGYQGGYRWQGFMLAANCLVRFTQHGHIFLIQNTGRHSQFHKNGLLISDGYNHTSLPPFAELLAMGDFAAVGVTSTRLNSYHHADWTRHIFWSKPGDGFFVVIDSVVADADGPFSLTCTWRTPAYATLDGRTWQSDQGQHRFMLRAGEHLQVSNIEETDHGASRPYVLRQVKAGDFRAGDHVAFHNLFYTCPQTSRETIDIQQLSPECALITREGTPYALCLISANGTAIEAGNLTADAWSMWLTDAEIAVTGCTKLSLSTEDWRFASDRPVGACIDLARRELRVQGTADVTLPSGETVAVRDGEPHTLSVPDEVCGRFVAAIRETLHAARPERHPARPDAITDAGWSNVWRYDSGSRLPERIRHATVDAEPAPVDGFADQLVDTMLPERRELREQWPGTDAVDITLSLPDAPHVEHLRVVGDSQDEPTLHTFSPLPDGIQVKVHSSDHVHKAQSRGPVEWVSFKRYRDMEDKLQAQTFEIGQATNRIDLIVPAPTDRPLVLHEIELYGPTRSPANVSHWTVADIDADGNAEIVLTNAANELIVIDRDGTERWRYALHNRPTYLSCHRLGAEPVKSICVGVLGGDLSIYAPDGDLVFATNLAEKFHQRLDAYQGWLNTIHESIVWHRTEDGRAALAVGGYAIIVFLDPDGDILGHSWFDGSWVVDILVTPETAPNGGDLWARCGWNHGITHYEGHPGMKPSGQSVPFGGVDQPMFRMMRRLVPFVTGDTVAFEWLEPGKSILAAADIGFGVLSVVDQDWRWKIEGGTPLTACIAHAGNILTAGDDGFLAAFAVEDGQPLRRKYLGDRIVGLAPLDAEHIVVATRRATYVLDRDWNVTASHAIQARDLKTLDENRVVVLLEEQTLHALEPTL